MASLVNVRIYTRFSSNFSQHQLDLAPYASEPYNAQWEAPRLLHDKHTLRSSRILGEMKVDEPWLGLWLPLNYQVDMGASQHRTPEFWVNSAGFFAAKFISWLVFGLC